MSVSEQARRWKAAESAAGKLRRGMERTREQMQTLMIQNLELMGFEAQRWYDQVHFWRPEEGEHSLRDKRRSKFFSLGVYITPRLKSSKRWPVCFSLFVIDGKWVLIDPDTHINKLLEMCQEYASNLWEDFPEKYPDTMVLDNI